jgi:hypothetical protein
MMTNAVCLGEKVKAYGFASNVTVSGRLGDPISTDTGRVKRQVQLYSSKDRELEEGREESPRSASQLSLTAADYEGIEQPGLSIDRASGLDYFPLAIDGSDGLSGDE